MYEHFFGLSGRPFSITPDPERIFWGHGHRLAYAMLEFGLINQAGFTVITGEIGSGKTTLMRHLLKSIEHRLSAGVVTNTSKSREELLQWIMLSFNQPHGGSYVELYERFSRFLQGEWADGRRTMVIVDEAQNLSVDAIEELRLLSNLGLDDTRMLQLTLIGQPQLRDLLRNPRLEQFAQRVSVNFHLRPLRQSDVWSYISYRLESVNAPQDLFDPAACELVADISRGIPRVINIICDTALVYAFSVRSDRVTADLIQQVIADRDEYGVLSFDTSVQS